MHEDQLRPAAPGLVGREGERRLGRQREVDRHEDRAGLRPGAGDQHRAARLPHDPRGHRAEQVPAAASDDDRIGPEGLRAGHDRARGLAALDLDRGVGRGAPRDPRQALDERVAELAPEPLALDDLLVAAPRRHGHTRERVGQDVEQGQRGVVKARLAGGLAERGGRGVGEIDAAQDASELHDNVTVGSGQHAVNSRRRRLPRRWH